MKAILYRYDLEPIEVEIVRIESEGLFDLYYCSDGSRVTKEMLKFL